MGQRLGQIMTTFTTEDREQATLASRITAWIKNYADSAGIKSLVVGVSGGIDSAVVSTLCARTGIHTIAVALPIRQREELHNLSLDHCFWLGNKFFNVRTEIVNLTDIFDRFEEVMGNYSSELAFANSRSRLRMMSLYQIAQSCTGIVVGTGNRVEDFGVGFFTKYGDGGVDISPIADLLKTEVWQLGRELGIDQRIIDAPPTDGLWADGRVDQDQLGGLTYAELEVAMALDESNAVPLNDAEAMNLYQYRKIRARNLHKMLPIPVFKK
jgi:NAD+ synthase